MVQSIRPVGFDSLSRVYDAETNSFATVGQAGALRVGQMQRIVGEAFSTTALLTNYWTSIAVLSGTQTVTAGELVLTTGVVANGTISVQSAKVARIITGITNVFLATVRLGDTGGTGNTRRWGMYSPQGVAADGFFFQLSGTTFSVGTRKSGTDTLVASTVFNGTTALVLDTNIHRYEIHYNATAALFFQDGRLLHKATYLTTTPCATLDLRVGCQNANSGGAAVDRTLAIGALSCGRLGPDDSRPNFYRATTAETRTLKNRPGALRRITVNRTGAAGAGCLVYDSITAAGLVIADIELTSGITTLEFNADFDNGLTFVIIGLNNDVTFVYE